MTLTTNNLKIVYGGANFNSRYNTNAEKVGEVLEYLKSEGITTIDTAQMYGDSETLIGQSKAASRGFVIDTKVAGGLWPHVDTTRENVIKAGESSLKAIDTDQVSKIAIRSHPPEHMIRFRN